jgi:hypothetical protein
MRLRASPGKEIWLFAGGLLFRRLLDLGLLDAIEIGVIPFSWPMASGCCRRGHPCAW